jgi:hypothetical protein
MLLGYPFVSAIHMTIHAAQPSPLQGAQSSQPPILTCDRRRPSSGNLSMVILKNGSQYCSGARCGFCTPLGLCFAVPDKLLPSSQCSFVNLVNSSILLGPNWSQTAVVQHKRQDKRANETRSRGCFFKYAMYRLARAKIMKLYRSYNPNTLVMEQGIGRWAYVRRLQISLSFFTLSLTSDAKPLSTFTCDPELS